MNERVSPGLEDTIMQYVNGFVLIDAVLAQF